MKLTGKKMDNGDWRVMRDGQETTMVVSKGDPPKWGELQMWWVGIDRPGWEFPDWIFESQSKAAALDALETISAALT